MTKQEYRKNEVMKSINLDDLFTTYAIGRTSILGIAITAVAERGPLYHLADGGSPLIDGQGRVILRGMQMVALTDLLPRHRRIDMAAIRRALRGKREGGKTKQSKA